MYIVTIALALIGAASVAAKSLEPLVEKTRNTWDNKLVNALVWIGDKLLPLLNGLALNRKK